MAYAQKRREELAIRKIQAVVRMRSEREKYRKYQKEHAYRTQVAKELLATEESYVAKLRQVVDVFLSPLRQALEKGKPILTDAEIRTVFMTVEVVVSINNELLEKLRQRLAAWRPHQLIGDIFIKIAGCFNIYTDYVSHFSDSTKAMVECNKKPEFIEFCTKKFIAIDDPLANLSSYLITPIQRIPRYELLLKDLLKHTWPDHADYKNLKDAVEVITNTAIHVNKKQLEAENIQKVIAVQNILTGKKLENLIDPQRRFVREGELGEVVKDNKAVTRYCVLFNDLMVKCKLPKGSTVKKKSSTKNQDSMKFEFLAKIPLAGGSLVNTGDEGDIKHSFQLVTKSDIIWLSCASEADKESWMESINKCIKALAQRSDALDKQLTHIAKQKASAAKNLIDEKYTNFRVHGSLTGALEKEDDGLDGVSFHSLTATERMQLAEKAGEKVKKLLAEEKEKNEEAKKKAADFKEVAGQKYKRDTLNGGTVPAEEDDGQPKLRKFASLKRGSVTSDTAGSTAPPQPNSMTDSGGGKGDGPKLREFAKIRRDTLTPSSSEENLNAMDSSDEPKQRRFASMKKEDYRKTDEAAGVVAGAEAESPRLRKFAQRRESLRKDTDLPSPKSADGGVSPRRATLTKEDPKKEKKEKKEKKRGSIMNSLKRGSKDSGKNTGKGTPSNGGGAGDASPGGEPQLRRFASIKKESYKDKQAADAAAAATPQDTTTTPTAEEEPKVRRFAQKNELYKNLASREK